MRRFSLAAALLALLLAAPALAGPGDSDLLVAPSGDVFLIDLAPAEGIEGAGSTPALRLRVTRDEQTTTHFVPASIGQGENWNPALAYDPASETLFILWVRAPQITTSEVLLTSYRDGAFGETTSLDLGVFRYRENLRVAITRFAKNENVAAEGEAPLPEQVPLLAIHAIWWDTDGRDERARYALLQVNEGVAQLVDIRNLIDFLGDQRSLEPVIAPETFDPRVLKYPSVAPGQSLDRADVVFGDFETNRLYRLDLVPVAANGVLKPPIGVRRGEIPAPVLEVISADSTVGTIADPVDPASLLIYTVREGRIQYLVFEDGAWTHANAIALDGSTVTEATAVDALKRRLIGR